MNGGKLDGAEAKRLREALIDAFRSWDDLAMMISDGLGVNLEEIVQRAKLPVVAAALIAWADSRGMIDSLVSAALAANGTNALLTSFAAARRAAPAAAAGSAANTVSPRAQAGPPPAPPTMPSTPLSSPPSTRDRSPPFGDPALLELQQAYADGELILFAGAGISAAAGLPSWRRLIELLTERARARGAAADALAEIADYTAKDRFVDAISALKLSLGPSDFGAAVEKHLNDANHEVPDVARAIAALTPHLRAVLTTNVDHLLERAFAGTWPPLSGATGDLAQRRRYILKLHGTLLDRSSWVFTRDDYDRAMYANPKLQTSFSALFHACPILFIGYGLADDDFDRVLARVRALVGDQPPRHFALAPAADVTPGRRARIEAAGLRIISYEGGHGDVTRILRWLAETA